MSKDPISDKQIVDFQNAVGALLGVKDWPKGRSLIQIAGDIEYVSGVLVFSINSVVISSYRGPKPLPHHDCPVERLVNSPALLGLASLGVSEAVRSSE